MDYTNKKVLILGLGESGLAAVRWLSRGGAVLRVADTRIAPERLDQLKEHVPNVEFISGQFSEALLEGIELIVVSPGLSELKELAEIIPAAKQREIPVWSEIELFAQSIQHLRDTENYAPKIIAITGTNGKTTVTSLVRLLVERAGKKVCMAGNISPSVLDVLRTTIEDNALPDIWVLELSSFQLHNTFSLNADVATVLNIAPDHLDWHGSMNAYVSDKAKIFAERTVQVLNRDDSDVMQMKKSGQEVFSFGQSAPTLPGEFGLLNENGMTWLAIANATEEDEAPTKRKQKNQLALEVEVQVSRLMPANALKIRGTHNALNALAALALCRAINLPLAPLLHGLREYQGEPHRVQYIATIKEVDYYDDSKGTNVHATVAAINGLGAGLKEGLRAESELLHPKILLIAGGLGKGQSFTPLHEPVRKFVSTVFLIGQDAETIAAALDGSGAELERCTTLEHAVSAAALKAHAGDIVLLSPACASFDMFSSYEHRGQVFVEAVQEIGRGHGDMII